MLMDRSNGYEAVSAEFLAHRGNGRNAIGVKEVRKWAQALRPGNSVIDLGCGAGFPITIVLAEEGLQVFGVDASPSLVAAFQRNLPTIPIVCESVLASSFFQRTFDAALSVGLIFLLEPEEQRRLILRFADIVAPGGHLLFTAPAKPHVWMDIMTGMRSISLGDEEYKRLLSEAGFSVIRDYEDEGENHYFEARKTRE